MIFKIGTLAALIIYISTVHILYHGTDPGFHVLHQQLYFIPLILASFWFGLYKGAATATLISLLFGIPMVVSRHHTEGPLIVITQIGLYFIVAMLIGWLSDRERKQQVKLFENERVTALGRAASALSFEVQDIVRQIEGIHQKSRKNDKSAEDDDMRYEINRLQRLLDALGQFRTPLGDLTLSHDLNELVLQRLPVHNQRAAAKGVKIVLDLDKGGCPSMVTADSIPRVIDSLVDNAVDFSAKGQSVVLRSERRGNFCIFEVVDSGPGVAKEHESKLFSVFFTTKPDGYGLSLSSGRKALRDLGGDLVYAKNNNGGAIFKLKIPRETTEENIQDYVNSALPKSQ